MDYKIQDDISTIDLRIASLKRESGTATSQAMAELFKAKSQLINTQLAINAMTKYDEMVEKEQAGESEA